jgi:parvulin-like peptidyl-prolyl isomerase
MVTRDVRASPDWQARAASTEKDPGAKKSGRKIPQIPPRQLHFRVAGSATFPMKSNRTRPFILAVSLVSAAMVFGADTKPKKAPAAEPKKAPAAEPAAPAAAPAEAPAAKPAPGADMVLATVDGDPIKASEIDAEIDRILKQRGIPPQAIAGQRPQIVRQMLDGKIIDKLVSKASAGIKVTDAEVDAEVEKIRKQGGGTMEEMKAELAKNGITLDKLKEDIRENLPKQKWVEDQAKAKFTPPTEAEAKGFYDKNPDSFLEPASVRASHILFLTKEGATEAEIAAAKKKAEAALARTGKEDFTTLAKELSEEPGAKESGGDLNFFPRQGAMVEPFAAAAFKLKKGEITPAPVRTEFGFHVIKVTDRKEEVKHPFEEAKAKIIEHLGQPKRQEVEKGIIDDLRAKAKVEMKLPPLAPAAAPGAPGGDEDPADAPPTPKPAPARKKIEAVTPPVSADPAPAPAKDKK